MAGDADIQRLTQAIKEHTHALKDLTRIGKSVNNNLVEFYRLLKFEEDDGARGGSPGSEGHVESAGHTEAESIHVSEGQGQAAEPSEGQEG